MKEREILYDYAKGIGIILLILGHLFTYGSTPFSIIFSFHMPLFFFLSGIFINSNTSLKKVLFSYLLPYIFFQFLIGSILVIPVSIMTHHTLMESYREMFTEIYKRIGSPTSMMESLWFLGVLAVSQLLVIGILRYEQRKQLNRMFTLKVFVVLSLSAILMSLIPVGYLPLRIAAIPGAMLFLLLGNKYGKQLAEKSKTATPIKLIVLTMILVLFAIMNKTVNISTPVYNDFFIFLLCSIIGIYVVLGVSNLLKLSDIYIYIYIYIYISRLGKNSLILFAVHGIWLRGYSFFLSNITGERYMFMDNIPHWMCLVGSVFVLAMSVITFYFIKDIYNSYFKACRKIIKF